MMNICKLANLVIYELSKSKNCAITNIKIGNYFYDGIIRTEEYRMVNKANSGGKLHLCGVECIVDDCLPANELIGVNSNNSTLFTIKLKEVSSDSHP